MSKQDYDVVLPPYLVQEVSFRSAGQVIDWGHTYLKVDSAYDRTRGENAVVFIVDTAGEFTHPDLIDNNLTHLNKNFSNSPTLEDRHGHGTHCAGIVAAVDNGIGVIGVAPNAKLVACKGLNDEGSGSYSRIADAIRYAADVEDDALTGKRRIVSLSLGGPSGSKVLEEAIDYAISKGVLVVAAAGNSGYRDGQNTIGYPGRYEQVITVASINRNGDPSSFSSAGPEIDVAAPGDPVFSTHRNGGYAYLRGTSMACPHVAGVLALLAEVYGTELDQESAEAVLEEFASDLWRDGEDVRTGAGAPILPGYRDKYDGEVPDEPDEPGDDPGEEDPFIRRPEKRSVAFKVDGAFTMFWRTSSTKKVKVLNCTELVLSVHSDIETESLSEVVQNYVAAYFFARMIVLLPDHDFQEAAYYTGRFLEIIGKQDWVENAFGTKLDIKVVMLNAKDEQGNTVVDYGTNPRTDGGHDLETNQSLEAEGIVSLMLPEQQVIDIFSQK